MITFDYAWWQRWGSKLNWASILMAGAAMLLVLGFFALGRPILLVVALPIALTALVTAFYVYRRLIRRGMIYEEE